MRAAGAVPIAIGGEKKIRTHTPSAYGHFITAIGPNERRPTGTTLLLPLPKESKKIIYPLKCKIKFFL